jgi:glycosyltransferase involved in cell wall biosynthesis
MLTFVIPTIGRDSLRASVASLLAQTDSRWRAVIVFDGIRATLDQEGVMEDSRIHIVEIPKSGQQANSAGNVRNVGISYAGSEWVAFLDDDDVLSPKYVATFYSEVANFPEIDLIIFRMYLEKPSWMHPTDFILPPLDADGFYKQKVGISFALRRDIITEMGYWFQPSEEEDYNFLNEIRNGGFKMMISPFIRYYVRLESWELAAEFDADIVTGNRFLL